MHMTMKLFYKMKKWESIKTDAVICIFIIVEMCIEILKGWGAYEEL